jgi:Tfp pilus assembly protein FimT
MVVVLAILAALFAAAYPRLNISALSGSRLRAAAMRFAAMARRVGDEAVYTRTPQRLTIDLKSGVYTTEPTRAAAPRQETPTGGRLPEGIRFVEVAIPEHDGDNERINLHFSPRGSSDPAAVRIAGPGGRVFTVALTGADGGVRVYDSAVEVAEDGTVME